MLGDSVFDNKVYINQGERDTKEWTEHFFKDHPTEIEFLALDGAVTESVRDQQVSYIDEDAENITISVGGNDLLRYVPLLETSQGTMEKTFSVFYEIRESFRDSYQSMLEKIRDKAPKANILAFDIYYPFWEISSDRMLMPEFRNSLNQASRIAIDLFNKAIRDFYKSDELISLSSVCSDKKHFANPIEPSTLGSKSIAESIYKHFALN